MRFLFPLGLGLLLSLVPFPAYAVDPCPVPFLPCGVGVGVAGAAAYIAGTFWPLLRYLFIGVAFGMLFYYALLLLVAGSEEQQITEVKSAYGHAIIGAAIVSLSWIIVDSFGPLSAGMGVGGGALVDQPQIRTALDNAIGGFKLALATAVAINLTIQGIRLIALQGNESELENQKKRFLYGLLGVAMILLVVPIVNSVAPGSNSGIITGEMVGFANFLLTLFGFLAVVAVIVGGVMIVISAEEGLKDTGKKLIFGSVIALIVVLSSYSIVRFFLT